MGRKSRLNESEKVEAVLALLRQQEPAGVLARRYGVCEAALYRWRDEFLEGGKAALAGKGGAKNGSSQRVAELERQLGERDRVIGELTVATRILCGRMDMGAYEFGLGDFNCDRTADLADFAAFQTGPQSTIDNSRRPRPRSTP